jgi:hypothetical protein
MARSLNAGGSLTEIMLAGGQIEGNNPVRSTCCWENATGSNFSERICKKPKSNVVSALDRSKTMAGD